MGSFPANGIMMAYVGSGGTGVYHSVCSYLRVRTSAIRPHVHTSSTVLQQAQLVSTYFLVTYVLSMEEITLRCIKGNIR